MVSADAIHCIVSSFHITNHADILVVRTHTAALTELIANVLKVRNLYRFKVMRLRVLDRFYYFNSIYRLQCNPPGGFIGYGPSSLPGWEC